MYHVAVIGNFFLFQTLKELGNWLRFDIEQKITGSHFLDHSVFVDGFLYISIL